MDPHANLRQQRESARSILAIVEKPDLASEEADSIADEAVGLAELVLALDDWRLNGGFDPYANTATRT